MSTLHPSSSSSALSSSSANSPSPFIDRSSPSLPVSEPLLTPASSIVPPSEPCSPTRNAQHHRFVGLTAAGAESVLSLTLSRTTNGAENEEGRWAGDIMNHPDVVLSVDALRFHAGDRKPADPFWRPRWEMANTHVALWNGLEQVYRWAPKQIKDELNFCKFAAAVIHAIDSHHEIEEEYYFPSLEVAVSMQSNLEQHASFDDGIRALNFYLRSCILDPVIYSSETITNIIDTFAIELATHFADELQTLDPQILREAFTTKDLDKQGSSLSKHIIKDYKRHLYTALPVLIISTPPGREWPLFSPIVRRILLPMVLGRKYKASWRYGKWPGALNVFSQSSLPPTLTPSNPLSPPQTLTPSTLTTSASFSSRFLRSKNSSLPPLPPAEEVPANPTRTLAGSTRTKTSLGSIVASRDGGGEGGESLSRGRSGSLSSSIQSGWAGSLAEAAKKAVAEEDAAGDELPGLKGRRNDR